VVDSTFSPVTAIFIFKYNYNTNIKKNSSVNVRVFVKLHQKTDKMLLLIFYISQPHLDDLSKGDFS
jgi:hypothetical protein